MNVYELIKDRRSYLPEGKIKLYMYQLCKAIYHMHRNGIFHRDVKPENILIKVSGHMINTMPCSCVKVSIHVLLHVHRRVC